MRKNGKQLLLGAIALGSLVVGGNFAKASADGLAFTPYEVNECSINYKTEQKVILIDPGHGGNDSGAVNPETGDKEAQFNMEIALNVKRRLEENGFKVILTRYYHKEFYEIYERVNMANEGDYMFFLSIHNNSSEAHKGNGTETYYNWEGATSDIAKRISKKIANNIDTTDRGAFLTPYFTKRINKPAVLVECEFIDNKEGLEKIKNKQDEISIGIVEGLLEGFEANGL